MLRNFLAASYTGLSGLFEVATPNACVTEKVGVESCNDVVVVRQQNIL